MSGHHAGLLEHALDYLRGGLSVLPAHRREKRASLGRWKEYQRRLPTQKEVRRWFAGRQDALCIVAGTASGHLEMIDFDFAGELFEPWREKVEAAAPGLADRLVIESTQSSGWHAVYRCEGETSGNMKLAQRRRPVAEEEITVGEDGREYVWLKGKKYAVRVDEEGSKYVLITLIETRGEGGLFLCAPTEGYEVVRGDLREVPVLTAAQRDTLLQATWDLNEYTPRPINGPSLPDTRTDAAGSTRPGDEFNERGDIRPVLRDHGWTLVRPGSNQYWRRPGKDEGWSASYNGSVFYCFTSNAPPFEMSRGYSRFAVYALLEHNGDYAAAASALSREGYGSALPNTGTVDLSRITESIGPENTETVIDPGPAPDELLHIPGFVSDVMEHTLSTSPYPNRPLAFAGALVLQGHLAGRRVRDSMNTHTNLYVLALGSAGIGKERMRKVNQEFLLSTGQGQELADAFASGEGIEDALDLHPRLLLQTDEFDKWLAGLRDSSQGRYQKIMETLLKMFSSSDGVWPVRLKANQQERRFINQPSLSILGTAVPVFFYGALSPDLLNNGFFARMLVVEAEERGRGTQPEYKPVPDELIEVARGWQEIDTGSNLSQINPELQTVPETSEAHDLLLFVQVKCDEQRDLAKQDEDEGAMALWARACEKTRRLALVYACSENHQSPQITVPAVEWAWAFVHHQTQRMLFMISQHVADGEFDALCLKAIRRVRQEPGGAIAHSKLLKHLRIEADRFGKLIDTLHQRGDLLPDRRTTGGRPGTWYRLPGKK